MKSKKFDFEVIFTNPFHPINSIYRMRIAECKCNCTNQSACYKSGNVSGLSSVNDPE